MNGACGCDQLKAGAVRHTIKCLPSTMNVHAADAGRRSPGTTCSCSDSLATRPKREVVQLAGLPEMRACLVLPGQTAVGTRLKCTIIMSVTHSSVQPLKEMDLPVRLGPPVSACHFRLRHCCHGWTVVQTRLCSCGRVRRACAQ